MDLTVNCKVIKVSRANALSSLSASQEFEAKTSSFCLWDLDSSIDNESEKCALTDLWHPCESNDSWKCLNLLIVSLRVASPSVSSVGPEGKSAAISHEVLAICCLILHKSDWLITVLDEDIEIIVEVVWIIINVNEVENPWVLGSIKVVPIVEWHLNHVWTNVHDWNTYHRQVMVNSSMRLADLLIIIHAIVGHVWPYDMHLDCKYIYVKVEKPVNKNLPRSKRNHINPMS